MRRQSCEVTYGRGYRFLRDIREHVLAYHDVKGGRDVQFFREVCHFADSIPFGQEHARQIRSVGIRVISGKRKSAASPLRYVITGTAPMSIPVRAPMSHHICVTKSQNFLSCPYFRKPSYLQPPVGIRRISLSCNRYRSILSNSTVLHGSSIFRAKRYSSSKR